MLLQRLREYSDRLDLPPTLYSEGPVRYIVELDANGKLLNRHLTDTAVPTNSAARRGQRRLVPQVQRSSGIKPLLLADKSDYVFGYVGEGGNAQRSRACHEAFLRLLRQCASETGEDSVDAVLAFLENSPREQIEFGDNFAPSAMITFRVDGQFPIDLPSVQSFWARVNDPESGSAPTMQCLVCGQERPVLTRLQAKIKGVPGGQTAGTSVISANAEAFESYGLEASLIAPTCADCGERFTKALNALLASDQNCIRLGGGAFVFWTREHSEFDFGSYLSDPQPSDVRALIEAFRSGRGNFDVDHGHFYATSLSGSGGRTVVRDWIDTTVGDAKEALARWFLRQRIVGVGGDEPRPLSLYALAAATVRDGRDLAPPTPRMILRSALLGTTLPSGLLAQAARRNVAEQTVTRPRAALIKLVLASQQNKDEEGFMVQLDQGNASPAYRCGRLLAVLEAAQRLAIPGIKATIVDRFFGTASTAPASVFPRLVRGAQPHLGKLERDRPGAFFALQRRLEDIQAGIPSSGFPRTLSLQDQGLFALGYYHQRAYDRAQAREAAERRKAGGQDARDVELAQALDESSTAREGQDD